MTVSLPATIGSIPPAFCKVGYTLPSQKNSNPRMGGYPCNLSVGRQKRQATSLAGFGWRGLFLAEVRNG